MKRLLLLLSSSFSVKKSLIPSWMGLVAESDNC